MGVFARRGSGSPGRLCEDGRREMTDKSIVTTQTTAMTATSFKTKQEHVESWVSNIAAPPVLAVVGVVLVALQTAEQGAWEWALFFGVVAVALPLLYVVWEVWRGNIADVHVPDRAQRTRPYLVALAASVAVWLIFALWPAPPLFRVLALANGLQALIFFLITLRWKISLHSAAAGGLTVLSFSALSSTGLWIVLIVPLIAWARVRLRRHTLAQTVGGAALGAAIFGVAIWVV